MRTIDSIIIHCSATKAGQDFTAKDVDRWHRQRGFNGIGYHYVVRLDGTLEKGRDVSLPGAHCMGWNERSIGICYIGGLNANGKPADTRTGAQKRVLYQLIMDLQREYQISQVLGHRDTSPDSNGDGTIEPCEYVKACPSFDVREFLEKGRKLFCAWSILLCMTCFCCGCRSSKSTVDYRSNSMVDSTSVMAHEENASEQSVKAESSATVMTERLEQIVAMIPGDTLFTLPTLWMKTTLIRKTEKDRQCVTENKVNRMDSLVVSSRAESRKQIESEKIHTTQSVNVWLKIGVIVCVFVGGYLSYLLYAYFSRVTHT